ncbi:hypothetical protein H0H87_012545 [Tephrocybe sp. NHM501043]|nr:hypothetical protein H0H87_012545 [Tephrocybe sp. NHM501043]
MTLRRSSRLATASTSRKIDPRSRLDSPPVDNDAPYAEPDYEEEEEVIKPKRKFHKKSKKSNSAAGQFKNVRGRRGALKDIIEMPLDILHEVSLPYLLICTTFPSTNVFIISIAMRGKGDISYGLTDGALAKNASPKEVTSSPELINWTRRSFFCTASAWALVDKYSKLDDDKKAMWMTQAKEERRRRIQHGTKCEAWLAAESQRRSSHLDCIRQRRCGAIKARLNELGWEEELNKVLDFCSWPSVRQPKDLTDRIWQNIKDKLIEDLERHKVERLEEEYSYAKSQRKLQLTKCLQDLKTSMPLQDRILPGFHDIVLMEAFSTMITAPTSEEVEFSASLLSEASKSWRVLKDAELRDMVLLAICPSVPPDGVDILGLATTVFKCWKKAADHGCYAIIGYPEVLVHGCVSEKWYHDFRGWNFDKERVFFDDKAHSCAKSILEASGLDPAVTRREEVYRPGFYIECQKCTLIEHSNGDRVLMTWHVAVSCHFVLSYNASFDIETLNQQIDHIMRHDKDKNGERPRMLITELHDVELKMMQRLEADSLCSQFSREDYACVRCKGPRFTGSWYVMVNHVQTRHKDKREAGEPIYLIDFDFEITQSGFRREPWGPLVLKHTAGKGGPSDVDAYVENDSTVL